MVCKVKEISVERKFIKYVSQNIVGMIGISAYILADTFFISQAEGARGITALNLVLPLYSLIFAIGSMTGVGAATKYSIQRARGHEDADDFFSNAIIFSLGISVIFVLLGIFVPDKMVGLLGGDAEIIAVGTPYTRFFMVFAPFFMLNYIFGAFVRNDGNPSLAMAATLASSIFNIIMDYVLMFPLKMGMAGAALATGLSPVVGVIVCSFHLFSTKSSVRFRMIRPDGKKLLQSWQLGISAFIGEMSSGVTTIVFNFLILGMTGNDGVAAYGIVANIAIVATAIFSGIAQGTQPLFSDFYGKNDKKAIKKTRNMAVAAAIILAVIVVLATNILTDQIVAVFNSDQNQIMSAYAAEGVRLYFIGFLFAGFNIVGSGYLSATEAAGWAFLTSIMRGFAAIIICAFVLAMIFGMTGIWLAFPAAEFITAMVMVVAIVKSGR